MELEGAALDLAVAQAEGTRLVSERGGTVNVSRIGDAVILDTGAAEDYGQRYSPSTDWSIGGPIIERAMVQVAPALAHAPQPGRQWVANIDFGPVSYGATPLIAAMRAYVASRHYVASRVRIGVRNSCETNDNERQPHEGESASVVTKDNERQL